MGDRRCRRRRPRRQSCGARSRLFIAIAATVAASAPLAPAATWIGGSGNWNDGTKWFPAGEPGLGGSILLQQGTAFTNVVVTFNPTLGQAGSNFFDINATNGGLVTFNQSAFLVGFTDSRVGFGGGHGVYNQSGGTHSTGGLIIGYGYDAVSPQSQGTYTLSAGTLTLVRSITVGGSNGIGTFTQSGGTVTISVNGFNIDDGLRVGFDTGSGTYTLLGGTLNMGHQREYIGYGGTGVFVQSGGVHTIGNTNATGFSPDLLLGYNGTITNAASTGSFTLNATSGASTLSILGDEYVGYDGRGNFNQSGGSHTVNGTNGLFVGFNPSSTGTFSLSGGTLNLTAGNMVLGYAAGASGTYSQTGGTNHVVGIGPLPSGLIFGYSNGASGAGSLSAGTLSVDYQEYIGFFGRGTFSQSGGSNSATYLTMGWQPSGNGTVTLSGGTVTTFLGTYVGYQGSGTFNHSGGTHNANGLYIGDRATSVGAYAMSNGAALNVSSNEYIGDLGLGTFTQTGGTHTLTVSGTHLYLGSAPDASGTYTLSGGTLSLPAANESIGYDGIATFNQSGGVHTMGASLDTYSFALGRQSDGSGTYNLSGTGLLSMPKGEERIGSDGVGVFNQSGGSNVTFFLYVGFSGFSTGGTNAARGVYNQSGGSVIVNSDESIGYYGAGTVNQSGGSHIALDLTLGAFINGTHAASVGHYTLSNGASLSIKNNEYVGGETLGTLDQTGGNHAVGGTLYVGSGTGAFGTYNLSGGTASSTLTDGSAIVGFQATGWFTYGGTFNQTGGYHTVGSATNLGTLSLGDQAGATGSYTLSDGVLAVNGSSVIGNAGTGAFIQSGGTHTITPGLPNFALLIGAGTSGVGSYSLSAGTLSTPTGAELVGYGGQGSYTQSGGNNTASTLAIGYSAGSFGTASLSGGTLTAALATYVGYAGNGSFTQSGGSSSLGALSIALQNTSSGTVTLSGGVLSAVSTVNKGQFIQTGGLASLGPVSGTGSLTLGNAVGATSRATVTRFDQTNVTIKNTGTLAVATNAARFTNTATLLSITGNGLLDLGNNDLLTPTPAATIRGYLINAYTLSDDWSGHGINSAFAMANPTKYTVGYANGNDQSSQDARPDVPAGKVLVVPTLVGDANLDHTVDFFDITQLLGYKYNTGQPASYTDGDLNYDGVVDFFDLSVLLSANYNSGEIFAAPAATAEPTLATAPEPAGALIVSGWGGAAILARQRRRRRREKHERPR
jgi:hypothetical protein